LGLTGNETFTISGITEDIKPLKKVQVIVKKEDGSEIKFQATARMDSKIEIEYYRNGGLLQYVLRQFLKREPILLLKLQKLSEILVRQFSKKVRFPKKQNNLLLWQWRM